MPVKAVPIRTVRPGGRHNRHSGGHKERGVGVREPGTDLLRSLHDEHSAALWSYVLHLTAGDRGHAEDVVQETLLRAWRRPELLEKQSESGHSVRGWLFTVAHNIVMDHWRSVRRRPEQLMDPQLISPGMPSSASDLAQSDGTDAALQAILVADGLRRLTADHRAVLVECYFRGCTAQQAAERLGIPVGTVKSRTHYALHALRLALEESGVIA